MSSVGREEPAVDHAATARAVAADPIELRATSLADLTGASALEPINREESSQADKGSKVSRQALWTLLLQHLSSTWSARTIDFAAILLLIEIVPNDLVPASIFGMVTTGIAVLLAGPAGELVDRYPRLRLVRSSIVAQKTFAIVRCPSLQS